MFWPGLQHLIHRGGVAGNTPKRQLGKALAKMCNTFILFRFILYFPDKERLISPLLNPF